MQILFVQLNKVYYFCQNGSLYADNMTHMLLKIQHIEDINIQ